MVFRLISTLVQLNSQAATYEEVTVCTLCQSALGLAHPICSTILESSDISQLVILEFTTLSYLNNIRTCIRTKTILVMPW